VWSPTSAFMGSITPPSAAAAMDMDETTPFTACSFTVDLGVNTSGIVAGVQFFPNFQQSANLAGGRFQGSTNGVSYVTLYTIPAWVQQGWTVVPLYNGPGMPYTALGSLPAYRFLRFVFATTGSQCSAREIVFTGIPVATQVSCVLDLRFGT
jgi:hypothetical protein